MKDKDDDRNHKFLEKDYSEIADSDEQRRIDLLIRAKKGIRNISVLNILIKRSLIEENHLRFNEDFIYYSDLPFVEGLVMYGHKIDFNEETLYAKENITIQLIPLPCRKLKMRLNLMNLSMFINMQFL